MIEKCLKLKTLLIVALRKVIILICHQNHLKEHIQRDQHHHQLHREKNEIVYITMMHFYYYLRRNFHTSVIFSHN